MRQVNMFGLPFSVGEPDELLAAILKKDPDAFYLHVCAAVGWDDKNDKPWPALAARRQFRQCVDCDVRVWFDPVSQPHPAAVPIIICLTCVKARQSAT